MRPHLYYIICSAVENSADLAGNFDELSETNVGFTFRGVCIVRKRYAPRSRHDLSVKAKTNVCRVELR